MYLREQYARGEFDTDKWRTDFRGGLVTGIRKFGTSADPDEDDSYFAKDVGLQVEKLARDVSANLAVGTDGQLWHYRGGVWRPDPQEVNRRVLEKLHDRFRTSHAKNVEVAVRSARGMKVLPIEPTPDYINLTNGMYSWQTGEMHLHDSDLNSTVQLPITNDPTATCPNMDAWITEVVPVDSVDYLWEVIGYMFYSGNPLHKAVLIYGDGGTGKSTLMRLLTHMIGSANTSNVSLQSLTTNRFAVASLFGKTANMVGDIDAKYLDDTSLFKAITGEDEIGAEHKYGAAFSFKPFAKPMFSANELWQTSDTTGGYFRRWLPLSFPNKVIGTHSFDETQLHNEAAGIFNKAMEHLRILMNRRKFILPVSAQGLLEKMKLESESVLQWLNSDEAITYTEVGNESVYTNRTVLYRQYKKWCIDTGHRPKRDTRFYDTMSQVGFIEKPMSGDRRIYGVALSEVAQWVPHP